MLDKKKIEESVNNILKEIGEDPKRDGLLKTPHRVAKAYEFSTNVEKLSWAHHRIAAARDDRLDIRRHRGTSQAPTAQG